MLGRVSGGRHRSQGQSAKVDLFPIFESSIGGGKMRRRRCEDGGSIGGQLAAARDEIGMKMRLHCKRDPQVEPFRQTEIACRVPTRINDQRMAIAERHKVGGATETLADK